VIADLPDWALALLREARVARLGTADRAGRPLVVPVCYALDEETGRLYSPVDAKPKRTRNLRRLRNIADNPRASLLVDRWDEDWSRLAWVMAEGRAEVVPPGDELARGTDLLFARYAQYRAMGLDRRSGTLVRLVPDRWLVWTAAARPS
jgi:PPOX class probable F420-dependent enzyme